KANHPE
ncbi:hypothetical protein D039_0270B, partial [Vibrio parahaemolyticus EKP-028]